MHRCLPAAAAAPTAPLWRACTHSLLAGSLGHAHVFRCECVIKRTRGRIGGFSYAPTCSKQQSVSLHKTFESFIWFRWRFSNLRISSPASSERTSARFLLSLFLETVFFFFLRSSQWSNPEIFVVLMRFKRCHRRNLLLKFQVKQLFENIVYFFLSETRSRNTLSLFYWSFVSFSYCFTSQFYLLCLKGILGKSFTHKKTVIWL